MGRALERHREANNLTRAQAGRGIGYSGQTIQRIEEATQATRPMVVEKLCALYGVDTEEMSHLTSLAVGGKEQGWYEPFFDLGTGRVSRPRIPLFLETEQVAWRILVHEINIVPGLLQTQAYLRELQAIQIGMLEESAEAWRALRTKRQSLLYSRRPLPEMQFLLGRPVIDFLEGMPAEVRDEQIGRMLEVAAMPQVSIRVLTRMYPGALSSFNVLFPEDEADAFAFADADEGCRYIPEPQLVSMYGQLFSAAQEMSVPLEEYLQ